jgi:CheY-like chemotaxis protein
MRRTLLLVDDEWVIAEALEGVLSDAGYRVLTAPNGKQALARLTEIRPDVILLDFMMPVMNGAATLAALAHDPSLRDIPVILMSSLPEPRVRERADGYAGFLAKPFTAAEALKAIAAVLETRR